MQFEIPLEVIEEKIASAKAQITEAMVEVDRIETILNLLRQLERKEDQPPLPTNGTAAADNGSTSTRKSYIRQVGCQKEIVLALEMGRLDRDELTSALKKTSREISAAVSKMVLRKMVSYDEDRKLMLAPAGRKRAAWHHLHPTYTVYSAKAL